MDAISYAYADEAHTRIDELEIVVTQSGDLVHIVGDVAGMGTVSNDGSITIETTFGEITIDDITGLSNALEGQSLVRKIDTVNGNGWRLTDVLDINYGEIGTDAIDLSYSTDEGSVNGATGDKSFAVGEGTIAQNTHSFASGKFNRPKADTIMEVGIGENDLNRKNAIEVYKDGRVLAPELTNEKIVQGGSHSFVTKKYIDELVIDCGSY